MLITAAALELDRTAAAYRQAAQLLTGIPDQAEQYLAQLQYAQQVQWQSPAGEAFRQLAEGLRYPGNLVRAEAKILAGKADAIATDLSSYADTARQLGTLVSVLSTMDFTQVAQDLGAARLESMRGAAAEATLSAGRFVQYVQDHGGIPWLLREAADRVI